MTQKNYAPFTDELSYKIWEDKYKDEKDTKVEDTWRRISRALAAVEKDKEGWEEKFYSVLSLFNTMGGRILSNLGTGSTGTSEFNCFVLNARLMDDFKTKGIDSMESIMFMLKELALTLKSEGGYGTNFSFLRPRGTFIKGIKGETPGAVTIMDLWNSVSDVITLGSGERKDKRAKKSIRKGALMGVLNISHPDIEEFISAKLVPGRLTKFNLSVGITDDFMEAVKQDTNWDLIFPDVEFYKYNSEWNGNVKRWKEKGYPIKVYKTLKARDLYDRIMKSTYERAEPGVLFLDRANELNNLKYIEDIQATNPCLKEDAQLLTEHGKKELKEIVIGDKIWSREGWTTVINKFPTGNKEVFRYYTKDGNFIEATENHKVENNMNKVELKYATHIDCFGVGESKYTFTLEIVGADSVGFHDVWDITVDNESHTFWCNGYSVSNCGENPLPDLGVCNLGSINLINYVNKDRNDWDYENLSKDISTHIRMLDNINTIGKAPLEGQNKSKENKRRIGQGILGYASALMYMKLRYGSPKALELTEKFCKFWANTAYKTSALLAKEKGVFPYYNREEYLKSKYLKILDEDTLKLIKDYGMRNSHVLSIAPTGNTSNYANIVSGGIEPVFNAEYIRTVTTTEVPVGLTVYKKADIDWGNIKSSYLAYKKDNDVIVNWEWFKEGDEDMLKVKYEDVVYKMDRNRGFTYEVLCQDNAVSKLKSIKEWDPKADWAESSLSLTPEAHIKTMCVFAKYVDSAISKTLSLPNNYSFKDFKKLYLDVWETGYIKGFTTYRMGTMGSVIKEQSKEEDEEEIIKEDIKLPISYPSETFTIKSENNKWYITTCYWPGFDNKKPFALFVNTNNIEKKATMKNTYDYLIQLAQEKGIKKAHIDDQINKCSNSSIVDKVMRMISLNLRHGVLIKNIVDTLDKGNAPAGSLLFHIKKHLMSYIKEGILTKDKCPICKDTLIFSEGCKKCKSCSYSYC